MENRHHRDQSALAEEIWRPPLDDTKLSTPVIMSTYFLYYFRFFYRDDGDVLF